MQSQRMQQQCTEGRGLQAWGDAQKTKDVVDAPTRTRLSTEESALYVVRKSRDADTKGARAQTKSSFASDVEAKQPAVTRNAPTESRREESAFDTEPRSILERNAAVKDAASKPTKSSSRCRLLEARGEGWGKGKENSQPKGCIKYQPIIGQDTRQAQASCGRCRLQKRVL